MTPVLFLKEKDGSDVFAYFPTLWADVNGRTATCYAHIGQHSGCSREYADECKEASFGEYCHDLLPELIGQGYGDLLIINAETFSYWRNPTPEEVKFGNGATHHKPILLQNCINPKTGKIKKWIKALDGLRYNYY
jgi:hypothetical protein